MHLAVYITPRLVHDSVLPPVQQFGKTPILPPAQLQDIGYKMVAYPLSLMSASIKAMNTALARLKAEEPLDDLLEGFEEVQRVVGFGDYDDTAMKYKLD